MGFAQEREMAERALDTLDCENEHERAPFPPAADRILGARQRLGLTQNEVAARWGLPPSLYWDLELYDVEAFTVPSIGELTRLAVALETPLAVLLFGEEAPVGLETPSVSEVVELVRGRLERAGDTVETLGQAVGWDLEPILARPEALADYCVVGLRDICKAVGVDWVGVLLAPHWRARLTTR